MFKCDVPVEAICSFTSVHNILSTTDFSGVGVQDSAFDSLLPTLFLTVEMLLTKHIFMFVQQEYTFP